MSTDRPTPPHAPDAVSPGELVRALAGEPGALDHLVRRLEPTVRGQVARIVARQPGRAGRSIDDLVDDLTQEVFVYLLDREAHVLRQWDPSRGRNVTSFVALVSSRFVLARLRTRRHHPWAERPASDATIETLAVPAGATPERQAVAREALAHVERRAEERLSPRAQDLYQKLLVDDADVEEICASEDMSPEAVYTWRSRLRRILRATPTWQS
ncbi:MAG: sigma-70 family RNA polymerase sigma factor [Deltaproteobacteria bacterium]|nr:MAG: sigma-70 family RNA polymerase sigma factor [Deltaproteobacteria bacterium]